MYKNFMFLFRCYVTVSDKVKCFTKMIDTNLKSNVNVYILDSIKKTHNSNHIAKLHNDLNAEFNINY